MDTVDTNQGEPTVTLGDQDVADGLAAIGDTFTRPDLGGVCVADGYGVSVRVRGGE
jgi:hypothetical protein